MKDTELCDRLGQLLLRRYPAPVARAKGRELAALIRDRLQPVATVAAAIRHHPALQVGKAAGSLGCLPLARLGALGSTAGGATSAVSYAATGAKIGTVAIPIPVVGTVIGLAVGAIAGFLIGHKDYINVNSDNAEEDQDVHDIWPQYRQVAGQVAGRDIGLPLLERVFRGAVYSQSDFPLNSAKVCFHAGCLKYPGNPAWIHSTIFEKCGDQNCFPDVVPKALAAGVTDPHLIVDQFYIPANQARGNHWAVPKTAAGRQVLVDIADAYVAQKGAPYFYGTPSPAIVALPTPIAPAAPRMAAPAMLAPPSGVMPTPLLPIAPALAAAATQTALNLPVQAGSPVDTSAAALSALLAQQGINMSSAPAQALVGQVASEGVSATPQGPAPATAGIGGMLSGPVGLAAVAATVGVLLLSTGRPARAH